MTSSDPKIGLALGAGGARGPAHIHVLHAFDDLGIKPCCVAGTSIGGIIGAAYCSGMTAEEIETFVRASFEDRTRLLSAAFKILPASFDDFLAEGGLRLGELNLERLLAVFLPDEIPETFEDLAIPLEVVATDFYAQTGKVFRTGGLKTALAASAAMPAVFMPVEFNGTYFIDGNAINPCPLDIVQTQSDHVIAVDVSGGPAKTEHVRPGKIEVMYSSSQIMQQSLVRLNALRYPQTAVLRPQVDGFRSLDFLRVSEILTRSAEIRDQARATISELLS